MMLIRMVRIISSSKSTVVLVNDQDDHIYDDDENNQDYDQHGNQDDLVPYYQFYLQPILV